MSNNLVLTFFKKSKKNPFSRYMVVVYVTQLLTRHCSHHFFVPVVQKVVQTTTTHNTTTMRANICVFEQINVVFVQTKEIYILAVTFTYYQSAFINLAKRISRCSRFSHCSRLELCSSCPFSGLNVGPT